MGSSNTISLFGSPRSGTTWISNLIRTLKNYEVRFEPLHREWYPDVRKLNLDPKPYLTEDNSELRNFLIKIINNEIKPLYCPIKNRKKKSEAVFKFVRGNRLLPWVSKFFKESKLNILLLRHPMAVINSQNRTGYRCYYRNRKQRLPLNIIKKQMNKIEEIPTLDDFNKFNKFEVLAVEFGIDYTVALHADPEIIFYEEIYRKGVESLAKILREYNINFDHQLLSKNLRKPSETVVKFDWIYDNQLVKWKKFKQISSNENKIRNVLKKFGIKFSDKKYKINNLTCSFLEDN